MFLMEADAQLGVRFFNDAVHNPAKSRAAGRAVFDDVEMIEIGIPGDKQRKPVHRAHQRHTVRPDTGEDRGKLIEVTYAERFPRAYEAFKQEREYIGEGTPINELAILTEANRKELRSQNVFTVETLAALDGAQLKSLGMGARDWKIAAEAFLDQAAGGAKFTAMKDELSSQKEEIERLKAMLSSAGDEEKTEPVQAKEVEEINLDKYADMTAQDLKDMIFDRTGDMPVGNLSKAKLKSMLSELEAA